MGCPASMSPISCIASCRVPDRSHCPSCGARRNATWSPVSTCVDDRACEPVTTGEHGTAVGTRTPFDVLELVDLVAGMGTEEVRQVLITLAQKVDDEGRRGTARCGTSGSPSTARPERGGLMLHCDAKPTRQPSRSPAAAVVTTYAGPSKSATIASKACASALTFCTSLRVCAPRRQPSPYHGRVEIISFASGRACPPKRARFMRWLIRWTALG